MPSKMVMRLAKRLADEFDIHVDPNTFRRSYAGHQQRKVGTYRWTMVGKVEIVGSVYTATDCANLTNRLIITSDDCGSYEIDVYRPDDLGYNIIERMDG